MAKTIESSRVSFDVLQTPPGRVLLRSVWFPVALQALTLVGMGVLVAVGFGVGWDATAAELMTLRKTNLTTLVVWGLWWPGLVVVTIVFGRLWCTVCPMELVHRIADAAARTAGWPRAKLGRVLRAGWIVIVAYLVLQLCVAGWSIHRIPHLTALVLLILMGAAALTGFVFRDPRAFCQAFCPAAALLSVYGRFTPFQLETRSPSVCSQCAHKDCVRAQNRQRFDKRSCPSLLRPFARQPSDGCVMCLQCAKVCPHDNVGVGLVASSAPVRTAQVLPAHEAAFVMVALGFVAHEVIGEVRWLDTIFHAVPSFLHAQARAIPFGWIEALWFLLLFPAGVWTLVVSAAYLTGQRAGLKATLLAVATGAAPIVAIAHFAKAAAKMFAWSGFLPLALRDPRGVGTLERLAADPGQTPGALLGVSILGWTMLVLVTLVAWKAWHWARRGGTNAWAARSGVVGASLLFAAVFTIWGWS
jgi:polyferredoxin